MEDDATGDVKRKYRPEGERGEKAKGKRQIGGATTGDVKRKYRTERKRGEKEKRDQG